MTKITFEDWLNLISPIELEAILPEIDRMDRDTLIKTCKVAVYIQTKMDDRIGFSRVTASHPKGRMDILNELVAKSQAYDRMIVAIQGMAAGMADIANSIDATRMAWMTKVSNRAIPDVF